MMTLAQAAQALGAKLVGEDITFSAVSTDSRNISAGDLFIALKGERFDGSAYVPSAVASGAVAAMVNAADFREGAAPCPLLLVDDTRLALGRLAAHWRAQFTRPVIALTGSNGKTTVKEMLAAILRQEYGEKAVLATQSNLNNDIGVPLTLLRLRAEHRYAVIEMGMNHAGEIDYLTRIAQPDVALITNASGAHLAGLGSVQAVANAKGEIFAGLKPDGIAVINADDAYAPQWLSLVEHHRVIDFGLEHDAAVRGHWQPSGLLKVNTPIFDISVRLQVPGVHNARNALAAIAAAAAASFFDWTYIIAALDSFGGVAGRLQRKPAKHGATLIDDTYNANPASMHAALDVLARAPGQRIFVMGDMGELGADAERLHADIGATARQLGIQRMFALGDLSRAAAREFGADARHFDSVESLCAALEAELGANVTVLVKGSRFMKMERVVQCCIERKEGTCC